MSGIVGSYFNTRGSGVVAKLGTDGQIFTSTGAGLKQGFEAAAGGGVVLRILYDVMTAQQSSTSNTHADTDLSIAITPASADNKILVICNVQMVVKRLGDTSVGVNVYREDVLVGGSSNNNSSSTADRRVGSVSFCVLDAPSTTSEITYKVTMANQNNGVGTSYINYSPDYAGASQLTLMEIAG
jgi:hypothetical protein